MKLTQDCTDLLKAAARLNDHIVIDQGSKINTISPKRNRFFTSNVPDVFPREVAFHDLNGFLRQLTLFDEPDLDFKEDHVVISDEFGSKCSYYYSEKEDLIYLDKDINVSDFIIEFNLSDIALSKILKASAANKTEDIGFFGEGGKVYIKTLDKENPKRTFSVQLGETNKDFMFYIKHVKDSKLTLLPIDYTVNFSKNGVIRFDGLLGDSTVSYYAAVERDFEIGD